jgi:large subunit ribosomal protein L30
MIGYCQRQRDTIKSLGFRKLGAIIEREDSPSLRGMLLTVRHLVDVEQLSDDQPVGGLA